MAIYTRIGHQRVTRIYTDADCYAQRELVQAWTVSEDRPLTPVKRLISDLIADRGIEEIMDRLKTDAKPRRATPTFPRITTFPTE